MSEFGSVRGHHEGSFGAVDRRRRWAEWNATVYFLSLSLRVSEEMSRSEELK
jgi:hypothetical protein